MRSMLLAVYERDKGESLFWTSVNHESQMMNELSRTLLWLFGWILFTVRKKLEGDSHRYTCTALSDKRTTNREPRMDATL